jgi:hypothetical protein
MSVLLRILEIKEVGGKLKEEKSKFFTLVSKFRSDPTIHVLEKVELDEWLEANKLDQYV